MARETIPSECFSGAWKWEKDNTVFIIVPDTSTYINSDVVFYKLYLSCSPLSILQFFVFYVKTLPIFNISVWLHDEFNLKWNLVFRSQCLWCAEHSFHVLLLQCLSVLLTNQDMDSNTVHLFTLILPWQIPFCLASPLSDSQGLSHLRLQSALLSTLWGLFVFRLPGAGRKYGLSDLSKILVIFTQRISAKPIVKTYIQKHTAKPILKT